MTTHLRTVTFDPQEWRLVPAEPVQEWVSSCRKNLALMPEGFGTADRRPAGSLESQLRRVLAAAPEPPLSCSTLCAEGEPCLITHDGKCFAEPPVAEAAGVKVPEGICAVADQLHDLAVQAYEASANGVGTLDMHKFKQMMRRFADELASAEAEILRLNAEPAKAEPAAGVSELIAERDEMRAKLDRVDKVLCEYEGLTGVGYQYIAGHIRDAIAARGK